MSRSDPKAFNYKLDFEKIDFRKYPDLYRVGRGEQGVLLVQPYKSEILPYWKFRSVDVARTSAKKIFSLFNRYKKSGDFVGMDMSRKFLQMGYTRARRYANHPSGRKYASNPQKAPSKAESKRLRSRVLPQARDWATNEKARAAQIFFEYYTKAKNDPVYLELRRDHVQRNG